MLQLPHKFENFIVATSTLAQVGGFAQKPFRSSFIKICQCLGPVYTVRTKFQNFLRSYVEGVYTIQNGAYERNNLTAYSLGGHNIMLNWMTEITDLLQFFVVAVKFGSDYASREVVCIVFLILKT